MGAQSSRDRVLAVYADCDSADEEGRYLVQYGSLDCIALEASFDRLLFVNLRSRPYWEIDRLREYRNRWQHRIMYSWKSFEYHEVGYTARTELCILSDTEFSDMEPPIVLSIWTRTVYWYRSRDEKQGSDRDKRIVRLIGLSEHVVGCVMEFLDTCRNGCMFS